MTTGFLHADCYLLITDSTSTRQIIGWTARKLGQRPVAKDTGYSVYKQMLTKHCFTDGNRSIIMAFYTFISPSENKRMIFLKICMICWHEHHQTTLLFITAKVGVAVWPSFAGHGQAAVQWRVGVAVWPSFPGHGQAAVQWRVFFLYCLWFVLSLCANDPCAVWGFNDLRAVWGFLSLKTAAKCHPQFNCLSTSQHRSTRVVCGAVNLNVLLVL